MNTHTYPFQIPNKAAIQPTKASCNDNFHQVELKVVSLNPVFSSQNKREYYNNYNYDNRLERNWRHESVVQETQESFVGQISTVKEAEVVKRELQELTVEVQQLNEENSQVSRDEEQALTRYQEKVNEGLSLRVAQETKKQRQTSVSQERKPAFVLYGGNRMTKSKLPSNKKNNTKVTPSVYVEQVSNLYWEKKEDEDRVKLEPQERKSQSAQKVVPNEIMADLDWIESKYSTDNSTQERTTFSSPDSSNKSNERFSLRSFETVEMKPNKPQMLPSTFEIVDMKPKKNQIPMSTILLNNPKVEKTSGFTLNRVKKSSSSERTVIEEPIAIGKKSVQKALKGMKIMQKGFQKVGQEQLMTQREATKYARQRVQGHLLGCPCPTCKLANYAELALASEEYALYK